MNKDSKSKETSNGELTPTMVKEAFDNLPHNYVVETQIILDKWFQEKKIIKTYSDRYVIFVRKGDRKNMDILKALVEVGTQAKADNDLYALVEKEKTPSEINPSGA